MGSEARAPPVFVISGEASSGFSCFDSTFLDGCIIFFALPSSRDCMIECSFTHSFIYLLV